jgi:ribosome-associated translation inhibitor RaiA
MENDVRRELGPLDRLVSAPIRDAHVVLTQEENPRLAHPARAEAEIDVNGNVIRGRVADVDIGHAVDQLGERMRRQLRRFVETRMTAHRVPAHPAPGEWRHRQWSPPRPEHFPRPAADRELMRRKAFDLGAMSAFEAAELMQDLDHDFLLFSDSRTGADAVVYVRDDGDLGVIVPAGTPLPSAPAESIRYEHSRLTDPLAVDAAVAEMDELGHRFLYFVNPATGRGTIIYLRYDGHYGLIEPAGDVAGSPSP